MTSSMVARSSGSAAADQEVGDVARHPDRDGDQQHADEHRRRRVPVRLAGDLAQPDADGGERDAEQRDRVFEEHHLHVRVATVACVADQWLAGLARLAARLAQRAHP
jgi:hypothetical protein